ncbi:MAG: hypothetical protein A2X86_19770 [Bdellovibrionales bacterium GWA2_49_15]|nr:MAG: hypothetical protein A2X86_19770 [Bdellovibrionales bacterium GWA2_49_15]HAZ12498.1 hypothetical protein [Bdellovibrionales bacterium]
MRRYSQFLTKNPTLFGLNPYDLLTFGIFVQLYLLFNWSILFTLIFCPVVILLGKLIQKYIDVTGFILGFRRADTLSLHELLKKEEGVNK